MFLKSTDELNVTVKTPKKVISVIFAEIPFSVSEELFYSTMITSACFLSDNYIYMKKVRVWLAP